MSYLEDPVFRALGELRDPASLAPMLARLVPGRSVPRPVTAETRLLYLNYKPFERARLLLSVTPPAEHEKAPGAALELALDVQGPVDCAASNSANGVQGWLPHDDPELGNLAVLRDPIALRARLGPVLGLDGAPPAIELIRYVPRRRAVLTITPDGGKRTIYAKTCRARDARALTAYHRAVDWMADIFTFRVPEILAVEPTLNTVFMSQVPGRSFTEVIRRAEAVPYAALGRALASLHGTELRPAVTWTTGDQLHDLRRHLAGMVRALPWLGARIETLVARLAALDPGPPGGGVRAIHGNLFGDQILWDGTHIGIVDWDRLALGDPLYDLGRLLAHHVYEAVLCAADEEAARGCADALLGAYAGAAKHGIERPRLAWHVAVELLLRAKIAALRPLPDGWPEHCARAVSACERLIEGRCEFALLPAPGRASGPGP